ncbi:MAG: hypothetical protein ACKV2O_11215 [Acidimicrobiales bacterium]
MWWVVTATAVLMVLTAVLYRLHRSITALQLAEVPVPVLVARARQVRVGFKDLDEHARQVAGRLAETVQIGR